MLAGHDGVVGLMAARSGGVSRLGCSSFKEQEVALAAKRLLEPPLALDVRMPPLHPKRSANIQALAAGHGSLFAGEIWTSSIIASCHWLNVQRHNSNEDALS